MSDYTDSPEGQYELGRAEYEEHMRVTDYERGFAAGVERAILEFVNAVDGPLTVALEVADTVRARALAAPTPERTPAPAKDGEGETP